MICNSHMLLDHKLLWKYLNGISLLNIPWILTRDFNTSSIVRNTKGVLFWSYSLKSKFFFSSISNNNLLDLGFVGLSFTWCNGQESLARRWARLVHFLANASWLLNYNFFSNQHLAHLNSDHAPFFLTTRNYVHPSKNTFRFENI